MDSLFEPTQQNAETLTKGLKKMKSRECPNCGTYYQISCHKCHPITTWALVGGLMVGFGVAGPVGAVIGSMIGGAVGDFIENDENS